MTEFTTKQGEALPSIYIGDNLIVDAAVDWQCKIRVLDHLGVAIVDRLVTEYDDTGLLFNVYLTPANSASPA